MEAGVHIGKGTIKHLPEDYVVPLFKEGDATFWRRESLILPKVRKRKREERPIELKTTLFRCGTFRSFFIVA